MILFAAEAFDPDDTSDAPRASNAYVSWKDFRVIGLVLLGLGAILYPVYQGMVRKSLEYRSKNNLNAIYKAMQQYMGENDDHYPPAYATSEGSTAPYLQNGKPFVWANLPTIDGGLNPRVSFRCPAADASEVTHTQGGKSAELTYGMYAPLSGLGAGDVESPQNTILIGETSANGALNSFDPTPFLDSAGKPVANDGFLIGFEDSNDAFTGKASAVTRLAYRDTKDGKFDKTNPSRHDGGINFVFADGHMDKFSSEISLLKAISRDGRPTDYGAPWSVPSRSAMRPE